MTIRHTFKMTPLLERILSTRELAKLYGVTQSAIWCVKTGKTWKPSAANNPFNQLIYA